MKKPPYFHGKPGTTGSMRWKSIPSLLDYDDSKKAKGYEFHDNLIDAVDTALTLNKPLLLTGEPGSGKTQLAYSVADELDVEVIKFIGKSDSQSKDLFYHYDTIGRFHAAQLKDGNVDAKQYVDYQALGEAILQAKSKDKIDAVISPRFNYRGRCRSLVLIDEIDKTPRDFPNDLLDHIEGMSFRVPELGDKALIQLEDNEKDYSPFVIITSNSEKSLPDAFLRRCIYYDIPFPEYDTLIKIIDSRLDHWLTTKDKLLVDVLDFFKEVRDEKNHWRKKPGTAELLDWLYCLRSLGISADNRLSHHEKALKNSRVTLFKMKEDQHEAGRFIKKWCEKSTSSSSKNKEHASL